MKTHGEREYKVTVGGVEYGMDREWRDRHKRGRSWEGKSVQQSEDVTWTEKRVGKHVSHAPRKAAIVHTVPVP